MKTCVVLCLVVAAVVAAPQQPGANANTAQILKYENENIGVDGYKFSFETSDPISRSEVGELTNAGPDKEPAVVVHGEYSYTGPDGKQHTVTFVADEKGFQPHTRTN